MTLYKTFKTVEELVEWVREAENIATLDTGEVTLKEWIELGNSVEKSKKDYTSATNEKKSLRKKHEEAEKEIADLTEKLDSVNNELNGLKAVYADGDKEAVQKLNKEKSDWIAKYNAAESKVKDLEKQVSEIPELKNQVEGYKMANNRARILEAVKKAAVQRKVPQHIIDDSDFEKIVADDFIIDETGNIFTKGESPQSVDNYIAVKQKEKIHWIAPTIVAGAEPMKSISEGGTVSDEHAAIAALFG